MSETVERVLGFILDRWDERDKRAYTADRDLHERYVRLSRELVVLVDQKNRLIERCNELYGELRRRAKQRVEIDPVAAGIVGGTHEEIVRQD